jgi:hypothetical protein
MAGMSDLEYAKVVEELQQSKAHVPGRAGEEWQRIARLNTLGFLDGIRSIVFRKNGYRVTGGAYDATLKRAEALGLRCKGLSLWQFIPALQDASHAAAMSISKKDDSVLACDRGLAEIDVAMATAERSPR